MEYIVHLPAMLGKVEGWLKGRIFTTAKETASRYKSNNDAEAALAKVAKFYQKRQIKACRIEEDI